MDVAILSGNSIRVKGKNSTILINPSKSTSKTEADGIVKLWNFPDYSDDKIDGNRIVISGPGEYEVGGMKTSGMKVDEELVAKIDADGVGVLVGSGKAIAKIGEKAEGADILVVNTDEDFNSAGLSTLEPNVILLYGLKKEEVAKGLGKNTPETTSKFSASKDKLTEETQLFLLG